MNDREIRRRGVERLIELSKAALAMIDSGEEGKAEEIASNIATWAAGGRDDLDGETFLLGVVVMMEFVEMVKRLGMLGLNGGE